MLKGLYGSFPFFLGKEVIPFKAAVAFHPYCGKFLDNLSSPLLILIGEKNDWGALNCSSFMPSKPAKHEVTLKVYPGAYHEFDWKGKDEVHKGHRILYDPVAAGDTIFQVKNFLAKYL